MENASTKGLRAEISDILRCSCQWGPAGQGLLYQERALLEPLSRRLDSDHRCTGKSPPLDDHEFTVQYSKDYTCVVL